MTTYSTPTPTPTSAPNADTRELLRDAFARQKAGDIDAVVHALRAITGKPCHYCGTPTTATMIPRGTRTRVPVCAGCHTKAQRPQGTPEEFAQLAADNPFDDQATVDVDHFDGEVTIHETRDGIGGDIHYRLSGEAAAVEAKVAELMSDWSYHWPQVQRYGDGTVLVSRAGSCD